MTAPVVIGIDPSLTSTGMSDGSTTWLVKSTGKATDDLPARRERLYDLVRHVAMHVREGCDLVVIEAPAFSSRMGHAHDRSGLWWLLVEHLTRQGFAVAEVPPTTLKKYATGKGNADKGSMIEAAVRCFPEVETKGQADRVDALWLAAMGMDALGFPIATRTVPRRAAVDAVTWPAVAAAA